MMAGFAVFHHFFVNIMCKIDRGHRLATKGKTSFTLWFAHGRERDQHQACHNCNPYQFLHRSAFLILIYT
jgi:hypothetical protein